MYDCEDCEDTGVVVTGIDYDGNERTAPCECGAGEPDGDADYDRAVEAELVSRD